ncbi:MAG: hypothetical protein M3042_10650 [Actinomycetota bacterium]|nr:hypothetical protein [Actinomycetota bacterium]
MRRLLVPALRPRDGERTSAAPAAPSRRGAGRRATSLLSVGVLMAGVAAVALATPASASVTNPGFYAANNVTGYCISPGAARPEGRDYSQVGDGGGPAQVIAWFATNYGPQDVSQAYDGGPLYPGGVVLGGVNNPADGVQQREGILRDAQITTGATPDPQETSDSPFSTSLLDFANAHPGPWHLNVNTDPGPYNPGTTYNGSVQIADANNNPVPVGGLAMGAPNQNNVDMNYGNGGVTDPNGFITFIFVPTNPGPFSRDVSTDNAATSAPVWADTATGPPNGTSGYQEILQPARGSIAATYSGTAAPTVASPAISTQVSAQTALVGDTITDSVTVTGSNGYNGQITWVLLGPVPAAAGPTCEGVSYAGAPVAQTGSLTAAGDNTYVSTPFVVTAAGCYTYSELLVGNATTLPAGPTPPGAVTETTLVTSQPTLSTQISTQTAKVGDTITDDVTVTGSNGYTGQITYVLLGPVAPLMTGFAGSPTCAGVDYTGAPTADSGSITANGDNTYTSAPFTVTVSGCYTYSETLVGNSTTRPAGPTTPGTVTETVIVFAHTPAVSTQISTQQALIGDTITDSIVVTGSGGYNGPIDWNLFGPVPATLDAIGSPTCEGVDYTGAPVAASGQITANGDNTYVTAPFTVPTVGCYTYSEYLVGNTTTAPAGPSIPGTVTETVIVFKTQPQVSTQTSTQTALVGDSITDAIKVTNSAGYVGPVLWVLLGPVTPKTTASGAGTCVGVNYDTAPLAASGSIAVNGDNTYQTTAFKVLVSGCYTYSEYLVGNTQTAPAGPSTPGTSTETTIVFKTHPEVSTQTSKQTANVGDTITDAIKVTNSLGYKGPVNWVLLGPVLPKLDSTGALTCVGLDWTAAPTAATGSVMANGDNTYTTAGYTVLVAGCYTYTELLVGNISTQPAGPSKPGTHGETVLVTPKPKVLGRPNTNIPFLAVTGSEIGIAALAGLALVMVGGALAVGTRRRRRPLGE